MRRLAQPGVDLLLPHQRRPPSTVSADASPSSRARRSPYCSAISGRLSHSEERKPPLRPLGPVPQTAASSTTTRAFGSRSSTSHAVHMPV